MYKCEESNMIVFGKILFLVWIIIIQLGCNDSKPLPETPKCPIKYIYLKCKKRQTRTGDFVDENGHIQYQHGRIFTSIIIDINDNNENTFWQLEKYFQQTWPWVDDEVIVVLINHPVLKLHRVGEIYSLANPYKRKSHFIPLSKKEVQKRIEKEILDDYKKFLEKKSNRRKLGLIID